MEGTEARSAGKRSRTQGLPSSTHALPAGAGSDPVARAAESLRMRHLMDAAVRPDLHLQAKLSGPELGAAPAVTDGPSQGLPAPLQASMARAFGADFSGVGVVVDDPAVAGMGAHAFARGERVHFAPGQYAPGSAHGDELIGHELAHVVQQREGRVTGGQAKGGVVVDDALEREADDHGARAAHGEVVRTAAGVGAAAPTVAQLRLERTAVQGARADGTWVWAKVPNRTYYKRATVTAVEPIRERATVTFLSRRHDDAPVTFDELFAEDDGDLVPTQKWGSASNALWRMARKTGSGRVISDTANTAGVVSGTSSLVANLSQQRGFYILGGVAGGLVGLGGAVQAGYGMLRGGASLFETATLLMMAVGNLASGISGIVSNVAGYRGNSALNTRLGVISLGAWAGVEGVNILANLPAAWRELEHGEPGPALVAVLLSAVKLTGGALMAGGSGASLTTLLAVGMAIGGVGTLASVLKGIYKLIQVGRSEQRRIHGGPIEVISHTSDSDTADRHTAVRHVSSSDTSDSHVSSSHTSDSDTSDSDTSDGHTSDSHTSDGHTSDSDTSDSHTSDSHTSDSHTSDSHTSDSDTADSDTADSHTADSHTADSHTADSDTADSDTADGHTSDSDTPSTNPAALSAILAGPQLGGPPLGSSASGDDLAGHDSDIPASGLDPGADDGGLGSTDEVGGRVDAEERRVIRGSEQPEDGRGGDGDHTGGGDRDHG